MRLQLVLGRGRARRAAARPRRPPRRAPGAGSPITAASVTAGCSNSAASTSTQYTFSPPRITMSLARSTMYTKPSSSMRATSPVWSQPSVNVAVGRLGLVPVALHDVRALDPQLADLADRRARRRPRRRPSRRRPRPARRRCRACAIVDAGVDRRDRRRLGQPVAVARRAAGEHLLDAAHELGRRRRAAVADRLARSRCRASRSRADSSTCHTIAGHAAEGRDALALDQLERAVRRPTCASSRASRRTRGWPPGPSGSRWRGRTAPTAGTRSAPAVARRGDRRTRRLRAAARDDGEHEAHQVRADVAMRAERALRLAGRARRVEDRGVVLGIERDVGQRRRRRRRRRARPRTARAGAASACSLARDDDAARGRARRERSAEALGALARRRTTTFGRSRSRPYSSSGAVHHAFSGTTTAPAAAARPEGDRPLGEVAHRDGDAVALLARRSRRCSRWASVAARRGSARRSVSRVVLVDEERRVAVGPARSSIAAQRAAARSSTCGSGPRGSSTSSISNIWPGAVSSAWTSAIDGGMGAVWRVVHDVCTGAQTR